MSLPVDYSRQGKRSRRRGGQGELQVRDLLRKYGWVTAHRQWLSGGAGGGDLADAIPDFHLEVKYVEALHLSAAFSQALSAARPTDTVVVGHRCNFQPWLASLRLTELWGLPDPGWEPLVIGSRGLRAEFAAALRNCERPLLVHQCGSEALCTVLLEDLLAVLAELRDVTKVVA